MTRTLRGTSTVWWSLPSRTWWAARWPLTSCFTTASIRRHFLDTEWRSLNRWAKGRAPPSVYLLWSMLKAGVFVCACCRLMRSTSISCQPGRNCSRRNSCKPGVRSSSPPGGAVLLWISCMKFGGSLKRILLLSSYPYLSPFLHLPPFSILCHPFFHSTSPYSSHSPFFLSSFLPFLFTYFPTTFPCYHILTSISLHFFLPVSLFFPYPFLPAIISSFIPSLNSSLSFILPPYFLIHLLSIILMSLIHFLSKPLPPPISFVLDFLNNYHYLYL